MSYDTWKTTEPDGRDDTPYHSEPQDEADVAAYAALEAIDYLTRLARQADGVTRALALTRRLREIGVAATEAEITALKRSDALCKAVEA